MGDVPERLPFTFHTHTGSPTGYSETATSLFLGLIQEGVEVHYLCVHDDTLYENPSYELVVNALRKIEPEDEPIQVLYSIAPLFLHNSGRYRVGFSMIETDALTKDYGGRHGIFDLTMRVEPGEILGFLGPNGAGKSTTVVAAGCLSRGAHLPVHLLGVVAVAEAVGLADDRVR